MKAINLEQVVKYFIPTQPLSGQNLRFWYVPRSGFMRNKMALDLKISPGAPKMLFVGHRGSGKSTELNKLAEEVSDVFHPLGFSVREITGRPNPTYEDFMLVLSTQLTRECLDRKLAPAPLGDPLRRKWEDLRDWWRQVVAGGSFSVPSEAELSLQISTLLGQVEVGARQSSFTRDRINEQINRQMPELIGYLNWVIEEAERSSGKRLLVVVEGLDKVDPASALSIFRDHTATITAPQATMIYTFPIALRHADDYNAIRLSFPQVYVLPNLATRHRGGAADEDGATYLRKLVLLRIEEGLIEADALDLLVHSNGGIPSWLVFLMRSAALYALARDGQARTITIVDAKQAVKELRTEGMAPLSRQDLQVLSARHRDHNLSNDPGDQRLLYNGSLIEYANDVAWCDAHPVLWSVLEQEDDDDASVPGPGT